MLKKLSIRGRLVVGFGLAIALSTLMIVLALTTAKSARTRYTELIKGPIEVVDELKETRLHINIMARIVRDMALNPNTASYSAAEADLAERRGKVASLIAAVEKGYTAEDNYAKEWSASVTAWEKKVDEIVSVMKGGDRIRAMGMLVEECTPMLEEMSNKAITATGSMIKVREDELHSVESYTQKATIFIWVLLATTIVLLLLFSIQITKGILVPLDEMKTTMVAMSEGDLHTACNYEGDDEVGVTAAALRSSQQTLSDMIEELDDVLEQMAAGNFQIALKTEFPGDLNSIKVSVENLLDSLNEVMIKLRTSGDQVAAGADQVSSGAQALAQGATEQASSVEELSATITEISSASKENAQTAEQVHALANEAGAAIEKSGQQMKEMLSAMDDISSSSSEISKIIKTIEDIAFQTNILALNAAVEAARAGTAGKGFAVVADEVRNLASKSAEASKNTAVLIEQAIQAVERGSALATGTANALEEARDRAREAVENIDHITDAVAQEASSIEQITIGIDQISSVVQTNSATSEESAAASEELSSQAQIMHTLLSRFQLSSQQSGFGGAAAPLPQSDSFDGYTTPMMNTGSNFDKY